MPEEPTLPARRDRLVVGLLAAAVGLLALLVLGLGVAGWMAYRTVSRVEVALAGPGGPRAQLAQLQEPLARSRELAEELTRRQDASAGELARSASETAARVRQLEQQLEGIRGIPGNPLKKLDQMIRLQVLLAEEQLVLMRHMVQTQQVLARSARPLPTQRELTQPPAVGGSGKAGQKQQQREPGR